MQDAIKMGTCSGLPPSAARTAYMNNKADDLDACEIKVEWLYIGVGKRQIHVNSAKTNRLMCNGCATSKMDVE